MLSSRLAGTPKARAELCLDDSQIERLKGRRMASGLALIM
jgi:hypothetical protein